MTREVLMRSPVEEGREVNWVRDFLSKGTTYTIEKVFHKVTYPVGPNSKYNR